MNLILKWITGQWLPLVVLAGCVAGLATVYGYGRSHGEAAVEARWAAQVEAARVDAAKVAARQNERLAASNGALQDAQSEIAAYQHSGRLLADRVRELAARPRNLPAPADHAQCVADLAGAGDWAAALGTALAGSNNLAVSLAAERDDAVARLHAAADAWPK